MGLFSGKDVKDAGDGIKAAGEGVSTVLSGVRTLITGDMPPETIERLKEIELEVMQIGQNIQKGQQEIERAAIEKGGFNSLFLSGWRPALGWVSVAAIFSYYVPPIILQTAFWTAQTIKTWKLVAWPNSFDIGEIIGLVGTILGVSVLRTVEKTNGSQDNH